MKKYIATILMVIIGITLIPSFARADYYSNVSARYTFDNADTNYVIGGTLTDRSGNGVTGSFVIVPPGAASSTTGLINQAGRFTGTNNGTDTGFTTAAGTLIIGTGDFTVSVWSKAANNAFSNFVATYNSGPANSGYALVWNAGTLNWGVEKLGSSAVLGTAVVMDGTTWHHFVATYSQVAAATSTIILYVDGVNKTSQNTNVPSGNITNQHAPSFGRSFASNPAQDITFEEMCIYSRALTQADVTALYNAGTAITCTAPVASNKKSFNVAIGSLYNVTVGKLFNVN